MLYNRLRYYEDIEVILLAKQADGEIIFALSFLLTPDSLKLIKPFIQPAVRPSHPNNVFLTSNNTRLSAMIPKGMLSHTIELLFSLESLLTHLAVMVEIIVR